MYIAFSEPKEALYKYFRYYLYGLKVGIVNVLSGSTHLKTGCGKSFTALRIGEIIDPEFGAHKVAFYPREFLNILDEIENNGKYGQVVVLDEGEISAPAQLWYSFTNKAIHYTLCTARYLRCMVIIVTPAFSWIDKRIRLLTSHWGYTDKVLKERQEQVKLRLYRVKTDLFGDRVFLEKIKMYNKTEGKIVAFKEFIVNLPDEDLVEDYLKKDKDFKRTLRKELIKEIEKFEKYQKQAERGKTLKDLEEIAKKILDDPELREKILIKGKVYPEHIRMIIPDLTFAEARIIARIIKIMIGKKK